MAIGQLKMLASRITEARSTSGEEMRKEKVTASGNPAPVKPMNRGIEEQEQNGVTVPSSAAMVLARTPRILPRMLRVRSGGKWLCTQEMPKISTDSRMKILMTS